MMNDRELLARLIAFESVSNRSNVDIADFVGGYCSASGCRVQSFPYDDGRKVNLVVRRGPDQSKPASPAAKDGIILSGHLDVVPADEPGWDSPPFALTVRDGKLIGRGMADMKAWVAQAVNLVCNIREDELVAPLVLVLTADEEVGSVGMQQFVKSVLAGDVGPLPGAALIGEPTELRVVRMHKGHLKARIDIQGKAAHSGYPHLGVNAIAIAGAVLTELTRLTAELREERCESSSFFPECPFPVLNFGRIAGGGAINVMAEQCEIEFGMRLMPGQSSEPILERVLGALDRIPAAHRERVRFRLVNDNVPMLCSDDAALVGLLKAISGETTTHGVSFASDAGWLSTLGIECALFGAGSITNAHRANEWIGVDEWMQGGEYLHKIALAAACRI